MLYRLTLSCQPSQPIVDQDYYYSILGAVMKMFENNTQIYDTIVKIAFQTRDQELLIFLTIQGNEGYNAIVSKLLQQSSLILCLDGLKFFLDHIKLDCKIFDPEQISYRAFEKFQLFFYSPTFLRQQNISYLLPDPARFLMSSLEKLQKLGYVLDIDPKVLRIALDNLIVGEYQLNSQQVTIKKAKKAGTRGMMTIYTKALDDDAKGGLYRILQGIPFVGMGSGVKLGLGNVGVKFAFTL